MVRRWVVAALLAVLGLAGCATTPVSPSRSGADDPTTIDQPAADDTTVPRQDPPPSPDSATLALLQQSERAARSGELDKALAYAERAVRLDPRRADLWTRLAELTLADGDPDTAIRYANKALSLAAERPDWQRDAWLIIADARERQGDSDVARAIRERWQTHRG